MSQIIKEMCEKHGIDNLYEKLCKENDNKIEIGFLGEFSSGKSSLINSLIGENLLISNPTPTTKTITEIGFGKNEFLKTTDNENQVVITKEDFNHLQTINKDCKLFAYLDGCDQNFIRNSDFTFIDTPGVSSLDKFDIDITFGYLPRLECAVICQDISQGSLTQSVIDFVVSNKHLQQNLIFCITKSDLKPQNAQEKIRQNIISQLKDILPDMANIEKRVVLATKDGENKELKELIINEFYEVQRIKGIKSIKK